MLKLLQKCVILVIICITLFSTVLSVSATEKNNTDYYNNTTIFEQDSS